VLQCIADFFTKPMKNWKQFSGFRRRVMNEPDSDSVRSVRVHASSLHIGPAVSFDSTLDRGGASRVGVSGMS
jgi:hypothetical protein